MIRRRRFRRDDGGATATGIVRGWICGLSAIPTDVLAISTESSTQSPGGSWYTTDSTAIEIDGTTQTESPEDTSTALSVAPTAMPITTSHSESRPADIPASTEAIDLGQDQNSSVAEGAYDCDLEVEDDCCTEADDIIREQEPCAEECVEVVPRFMSPGQKQRRRRSEVDLASVPRYPGPVGSMGFLTRAITITEAVRPVATAVPAAAPGVTITEAVLVASTAYANQGSRASLSEVTRTLTIVPPAGTRPSSNHPKTSDGPRGGISKEDNDSETTRPKVIGAVIGSLLGAFLVIGLLWWCYRIHRQEERARRLREHREANPVSSRITANSYL